MCCKMQKYYKNHFLYGSNLTFLLLVRRQLLHFLRVTLYKVTRRKCKSCRLPKSKIVKFDPQRRRFLWYFCILQHVNYKCCNIGCFSDLSSSYKFIINWFCSRIFIFSHQCLIYCKIYLFNFSGRLQLSFTYVYFWIW